MTTPRTLTDIERAVRAAWSRETCDPADLDDWTPDNPSRGQCGVTALVLNDLLGGDLLVAEVLHPDGTRQGFHWWNQLGRGIEVDLTREQFDAHEHVQEPRVVVRPESPPVRCRDEYLLLRRRVLGALAG